MVVQASHLSKHFGDLKAVDDVSFHIGKGECFGLLGPNGAGKSTVISMIYGAASRSGGELEVLSKDPAVDSRSIKERMGIVTQDDALDLGMNVYKNMMMFACMVGIPKAERKPRVDALLKFMSLDHKKEASIRMLSGGMQRRLVFVRALLNNPDFVILEVLTEAARN
jgi:lipooligosaccharide transport system ATP-binding protein